MTTLQSIARKQGHAKHVLVIKASPKTLYVCDEYYPTDNGRVHILGDNAYAHFHIEQMVLDLKKAAIEISSVVFVSTTWPRSIQSGASREQILAHFGYSANV